MIFTPEDVRIVWNANCGDLPKCNDMGILARVVKTKALLLRLSAATSIPNLERLAAAVKRIAVSPYCNGGSASEKHPLGFIASFDWFLNPETLTLIEEGKYDPPKEIRPPDPEPADKTTHYWNEGKPLRWEPSPEEFLRCQVQGLLTLALERSKGRHIKPTADVHYWMDHGGKHPWASDEEVAEATAKVTVYRQRGELPKSVDDFGTSLKTPGTFKEIVEKRRQEAANAPSKAKETNPEIPSEDNDDPW